MGGGQCGGAVSECGNDHVRSISVHARVEMIWLSQRFRAVVSVHQFMCLNKRELTLQERLAFANMIHGSFIFGLQWPRCHCLCHILKAAAVVTAMGCAGEMEYEVDRERQVKDGKRHSTYPLSILGIAPMTNIIKEAKAEVSGEENFKKKEQRHKEE